MKADQNEIGYRFIIKFKKRKSKNSVIREFPVMFLPLSHKKPMLRNNYNQGKCAIPTNLPQHCIS